MPRFPFAHAIPRRDLRADMGVFGETVAGDHKPKLQAVQ